MKNNITRLSHITFTVLFCVFSTSSSMASDVDLGQLVQQAMQGQDTQGQTNYSTDHDPILMEFLNNPPSFPEHLMETKEVNLPGTDKIDKRLRALMGQGQTKGFFNLAEEAESKGIAMTDNMVAVTLTAESTQDLYSLENKVLDLGGHILMSFENNLYAYMPLDTIEQLGNESSLFYLAPQTLAQPISTNDDFFAYQEKDTSWDDGLKATGAEVLHKKGIHGKGVKVGIIDPGGFAGYDKLKEQGILPEAVAYKNFQADGKPYTNTDNEGVHGTACAEIIHKMAPDAKLYLAETNTRAEMMQAATWMAEQGVKIISYSAGGFGLSMNGNNIIDRFLTTFSEKYDILFVASAGNSGKMHWMSTVQDKNNDGFLDVTYPEKGSKIFDSAFIRAKGKFMVMVNWDDWGSDVRKPTPTLDLDVYIFEKRNNKVVLIDKSTNPQNGRGAPLEMVQGFSDNPKNKFFLGVKINSPIKKEIRLHLYISGMALLNPQKNTGSVANPATGRDALAVGAINVADGKLAAYSSQGKTDDGRIKPEISAPAGTLSHAYELTRNSKEFMINQPAFLGIDTKATGKQALFHGTSAACPHVAGAAALIKEMYPDAYRKELWKLLTDNAKPMGDKIPNSETGHGYLNVGNIKAAPKNDKPQATGDQEQPTVEDLLQNILN